MVILALLVFKTGATIERGFKFHLTGFVSCGVKTDKLTNNNNV